MAVGNVNPAFELTVIASPPSSWRVIEAPAANPVSVPPIVKVSGAQLTLTLVIFAEPTVPEPALTEHIWLAGWVPTLTLYCKPTAIAVGNVNGVFALTVIESPPLSRRTTEVPEASPETVPPIV
jgi:hypothetical protein